MLGRLKLGFSHLCEHKFRQRFKDTLNSLRSCSIEVETATNLENILISFSTVSDNNLISLLLYGDDKFDTQRIKKC